MKLSSTGGYVIALAGGALLWIGLVLFGILALPPMLAAQLGAWLRRRSQTVS